MQWDMAGPGCEEVPAVAVAVAVVEVEASSLGKEGPRQVA
jgi:hypothetical protein